MNKIKQFDGLITLHLRLSEFTYDGLKTLFTDLGYIHDNDSEFDFVAAWVGTHRDTMKSRIDSDKNVYFRIED